MKALVDVSLICLLCFPICLQAQSDIDSLKALLSTTQKDSAKFKILGQISWEYIIRQQLDPASQYADSIRFLAEKLRSEERMTYARFYYGVIARNRGNYAEALDYLHQYVIYNERTGDSARVASGLFQIGVVNKLIGDYDKSLEAFFRILKIYENDSNYLGVGYTLNGIGVIYKNMKKYEDAIKTYHRALSMYDSLDAAEDKANVLGNLANVYAETHQFEEARGYFEQALQIDKALDDEQGIAYDLENIGVMYNHMKKYDSALVYQLESLLIRERLPDKNEYAATLQQVGYTYYLLKNYAEAKMHLMKSFELATEIKAKPTLRDVYVTFAKIYDEEQNFKKAFEYHQLFAAMKDSLLNEEISRQLSDLQTKYETEKKEKEIVLLGQEKEMQKHEAQRQATLKKASLGGLFAVLLLAVLFIHGLRQRLKNQKVLAAKNEEIKEVNFKRQLSELEMKALRAQINPHFLFNCMNSINRMILNGETENASRYLTKFSKLVRLILENSEEPTVSLENELMMLESYIQLEALRFKGKINYQIVIDEAIEPESTYLPSMVLQPFVENAIWHGLMHKEKEDKGMITIAIREDEDRLLCTIEDNGVGREKANVLREKSVLKSKSMGMKITEERLRLLSKQQLEQLIRITDLKDAMDFALGTRIEINIPIS